jgi:hypothetical protein
LEILPFGVKGGQFGMFKSNGEKLKNFTLSAIDGAVK